MKKSAQPRENNNSRQISDLVTRSFSTISPFWPLKNLIAVNPLQGLEEMPIEEALKTGSVYFEQDNLPEKMAAINLETIKWLQAFFDEGQATIPMPLRQQGLYKTWWKLAAYDKRLHHHDRHKKDLLRSMPETAEQVIAECLLLLNIAQEEHEKFLTLMLTTLPGWAAHIKYRTEWAGLDVNHPHPVTQADYLAIRLTITSLFWPEAQKLLAWHKQAKIKPSPIEQLRKSETAYRLPLLKKLAEQKLTPPHTPSAQFVFCIDVRSEPFRRAVESTGDYQTFGFAGFFGIPVQITDSLTGESYASCPVLLAPKHEITESPCGLNTQHDRAAYEKITSFKRLYQSLKYTFTTPFALVELLGIFSGIWMSLRTLMPQLASKLKTTVTNSSHTPRELDISLDAISHDEQCSYAEGALRMIGLTHHFSPLVVFCGHGSATQNNAYATSLDCGACGGRHGASNARILATILNRSEVRKQLAKNNIIIPEATLFIAAEHNTTTDEVTLYGDQDSLEISTLKHNLAQARATNSLFRLSKMEENTKVSNAAWRAVLRSKDWAQVRPEWGLARNAAFIIAPRDITAELNLEGRCFLHSYDDLQDDQGNILTAILTAPMVVAQWINMQYLFSTLDNVAYGGGSKITKNITGKIGIMQGNASDLMTGLPLQSVYSNDQQSYHEPQRLMTIVFANRQMLDAIIKVQPVLQKLFGNGWVQLACIEPKDRQTYFLNRDFTWQPHLSEPR